MTDRLISAALAAFFFGPPLARLLGLVAWPWWAVLAPLWVPPALVLMFLLVWAWNAPERWL